MINNFAAVLLGLIRDYTTDQLSQNNLAKRREKSCWTRSTAICFPLFV